jgi:histidine ammonia-lyase
METVIAGTGPLSFAEVVARGGVAVALSAEAEAEIAATRKVIDALSSDAAPHYGVSAAARALDLRSPLVPGPATAAVTAGLRVTVEGPGPDRFPGPEIEAAVGYVARGGAVRAAEAVTGALK